MFTLLYNTLKVIKQLPKANNCDEPDHSKSLSDFTDTAQMLVDIPALRPGPKAGTSLIWKNICPSLSMEMLKP
jgi:hypothetical protein